MKQGYNDRLDESLGARNGKKSQSMKDRRDESKAMSKNQYSDSVVKMANYAKNFGCSKS